MVDLDCGMILRDAVFCEGKADDVAFGMTEDGIAVFFRLLLVAVVFKGGGDFCRIRRHDQGGCNVNGVSVYLLYGACREEGNDKESKSEGQVFHMDGLMNREILLYATKQLHFGNDTNIILFNFCTNEQYLVETKSYT